MGSLEPGTCAEGTVTLPSTNGQTVNTFTRAARDWSQASLTPS
jgi:hypothetical protein